MASDAVIAGSPLVFGTRNGQTAAR